MVFPARALQRDRSPRRGGHGTGLASSRHPAQPRCRPEDLARRFRGWSWPACPVQAGGAGAGVPQPPQHRRHLRNRAVRGHESVGAGARGCGARGGPARSRCTTRSACHGMSIWPRRCCRPRRH